MIDDPNWKDVQSAIKRDDIKALQAMIAVKPELLHLKTVFGTWMHVAADFGRVAIVKLLIELGGDINARGGPADATPIHSAVSEGNVDVVKFLLEHDAALETESPERNPLFAAIYAGNAEIARLLIEAGMDLHIVYLTESGEKRNALSYSHDQGQGEICEMLVAAGCVFPAKKTRRANNKSQDHNKLVACIRRQYGRLEYLSLQEIVPIDDEINLAIHVVRPSKRHPWLTLVTIGMSDKAMTVPIGMESYRHAELVIHLPADWPFNRTNLSDSSYWWPVSWMRQLAYYPHKNNTWLGGHYSIVANGEPPAPLGPNTLQSCWLLAADMSEWSPVELGNGKIVHFYTMNSLYAEERALEIRDGLSALAERFSKNNILAVVDPARKSVARDLN